MKKNQVVSIERLFFSYNGFPVLEDVNLSVNETDFVWVVGPNGGGKTTLLKLILGLLHPEKGKILVFGTSPKEGRRRIGYMPQAAHLDRQFPVTVLEVALMGRLGNGTRFGMFARSDRLAAENALDEVGLLFLKDRPFSSLSGGQERRLLIARALAGEPEILILDEPTANLDPVAEEELHKLLRRLNERLTIILVSHNPNIVSEFVMRVICVNKMVSEHPTCEVEGAYLGDLSTAGIRMVRHDRKVGREPTGE
jgi:zinc transport system ATP-binding protein